MACGYRGAEVQSGYPVEVFVCPGCGCDLYTRPPRSFAEMEGVDSASGVISDRGIRGESSPNGHAASPVVVAARWLGRVVRRLLLLDGPSWKG